MMSKPQLNIDFIQPGFFIQKSGFLILEVFPNTKNVVSRDHNE
jgi:hypothetical protein